jgi:hypothetical protein
MLSFIFGRFRTFRTSQIEHLFYSSRIRIIPRYTSGKSMTCGPGVSVKDGVLWFWIGSHAEYDRLIGEPRSELPSSSEIAFVAPAASATRPRDNYHTLPGFFPASQTGSSPRTGAMSDRNGVKCLSPEK